MYPRITSSPSRALHLIPYAIRPTPLRSRPLLSAMASSSSKPGERVAQTPRPSASLVIINRRNEVLLVHRNPEARSFGGVHVFPGGNLDAAQDASLAVTAIRETFEESGILIASGPRLADSVLDEGRHSIHSGKTPFQAFLTQHSLEADVKSLMPFTQWITPVFAPRRFQTQFYVAFLGEAAGFSSGAKEDRIPKPDGGQEVIEARFLHPDAALAEFGAHKISLMPPQFYIIHTLAGILRGGANTAEQRARVEELASGAFGRMVFNPQQLGPPDEQGRIVLTYEGDHARGGPQGRLHRATMLVGKGGAPSEITLERSFDVFSGVETLSSKL
ncbi:NUDIX hydrolase domain-like protein [Mycena rebaudengoi]|nr:NUDIX hydrolase domain-like protein [Mycena rebaudengoi]